MTDIVFVGEAWGEHESLHQHPFVGPAGQELMRMLAEAGYPCQRLSYNSISANTMVLNWESFPYPLLNVFNERPEENNVEVFYGGRHDDVDYSLPSRKFGSSIKYVLSSKAHHIHTLYTSLQDLQPNVIVALGATAVWALKLGSSINKVRGFIHETPFGKVLPTYHPAAVLRKWNLRITTILDLVKAKKESLLHEVKLVEREIWTEPTIDDLWLWWRTYGQHAEMLSFDIETLRQQQISEVGFASDPTHALHIPFCIETYKGKQKVYEQWWPDAKTETEAWKFVKYVCESDIPKLGQNCIQYDTFWLARELGIVVRNIQDDTMTMAHAWMPEFSKKLYDLGAAFLDERSWKGIRKDTVKDND